MHRPRRVQSRRCRPARVPAGGAPGWGRGLGRNRGEARLGSSSVAIPVGAMVGRTGATYIPSTHQRCRGISRVTARHTGMSVQPMTVSPAIRPCAAEALKVDDQDQDQDQDEDRLRDLIPRMRQFARALTRDGTAADDLVQAALERALRAWASRRKAAALQSWLFSI